MTHVHRRRTRGLLVVAALAVLVMAAAAAAGRPAGTSPRRPAGALNRFRFMRAREGFASPKALLDTLSSTPVGKWHLGDAKDALDMLRHMFSVDGAAHFETSAAFWTEAQTKNKGGKNLSSKHADDEAKALFAYILNLRKKFREANGAKKVLIRGAGPAGLTAALYAKLRVARLRSAVVHVVDNRGDYTRMHPVTLKKEKTLASCNDYTQTTIKGASYLLHGYLGADKLQEFFFPYEPNGDNPQIPTYKLEYHLALAAHIVGVTFTYGAAADMPTGGTSKADTLSSFKSDKNGQGKWKAIVKQAVEPKCPAALPDVTEARRQFATQADCDEYDVVIAADGVSSHTRRFSPCFKSSGTSPGWGLIKFHASTEGTATLTQKVSSLIETHGGLPSLAFVMKETDPLVMRPLPDGHTAYPELRKGFFTKLGMTEVALNIASGNRFLNAFTRKCSFNYNVKSTTQATDNDLKDLRLAFHVFSNLVSVKDGSNDHQEGTNKKRYDGALARFKKVQEFKVWVTNFNAATHVDAGDKKVYTGTTYGDGGAKVAMIIGDAAREALPDDGMGANDAHHTAMMAIKAAANLGTDDFTTTFNELQDHTTDVAALIQCKNAAAYGTTGVYSVGHPLLHGSNLKFSETATHGSAISFENNEY